MVYFRLKENTVQAYAFVEYIKTLPFIDIVDEFGTKISKEEFLKDFKASLREVKAKKTKPLKELLNV